MNYQHPNYGTSAVRTSEDAGQLTFNPFKFDFAADYAPAAIASADTIVIGVVPAGEKMVPHLTLLSIPSMDSGSPTGDYSVGTAAAPAALKAAAAAETAAVLSGEDWVAATSEIGDRYVDTLILITFTNNVATPPTTGVLDLKLVTRPWDEAIDG